MARGVSGGKIAITGNTGLVSAAQRLGLGERGAFVAVQNMVCKEAGVLQPREGRTDADGADTGFSLDRVWYDRINLQVLRASTGSNRLQKGTTSFSNLDTTRKYCAHTISRNTNYLLSNEGLRRLNAGNTATEIAGIPEALDINIESLPGTTGWMPVNTQVGYRVLFGLKLSNNEFFLGAPSGRGIAINAAGGTTHDVTFRFSVPAECTTSHFYQVYRTQPSVASTVDPGDEMFLIYENFLTSSDISNKYVEFTDRVPNGNGGASLYTNDSQQTIIQANVQCEAAMGTNREGSLASYAGCVWSSSYKPRSNITIYLLSVLTDTGLNVRTIIADTTISTNTISDVSAAEFTGLAVGMYVTGTGIPANTTVTALNTGLGTITISNNATSTNNDISLVFGDIITIAGTQYFAGTAENISTRTFLVSTDSSAAKAVRLTAESLVRVINRNTTNAEVYATYQSGSNDLPGRIYIYARTDRASTYTIVASSHGSAWSPNLTTAQTILSKEDQSIVLFSKPDEPHAFPFFNFVKIPESAVVCALTALRAALLIWTDKGLYRVTGEYGNFVLDLVDDSVRNFKPNVSTGVRSSLAAVSNNIAYCHTDRGITAATESGTTVISLPIKNYVEATLTPSCYSNDIDMFVYVPCPAGGNTLVYHANYNLWTMIDTAFATGVFNQSGRSMYFTTADRTFYSAIKSFSIATDGTNAVTINAVASTTINLASVPSGTKVGDTISQGSVYQTIEAINGTILTVANGLAFTTGAATRHNTITSRLTYCPIGSPDPSITKHYRYTNILFDGNGIDTTVSPTSTGSPTYISSGAKQYVTLGFRSDIDETVSSTSAFVTDNNNPYQARFIVPQTMQRASILNPSITINAYDGFRLLGLELDYIGVSDKTRR